MTTYIQTIIVGGGQAGLSVSYYLSRQGRQHIVLEQAEEPANAWRHHRWDSFTLNTPNWQSRLPGMEIPGDAPNGFLSRQEIIRYLEDYVERFQLPVRCGVRVESVEQNQQGDGYTIRTTAGQFEAENIVIATGLYQLPRIPEIAEQFPHGIQQLHSDQYKNPQSLPTGSVLVIGSAQSGAQIAEELNHAGRKVYLSVSRAGRAPRRYRGEDVNKWQDLMGTYDRTVDQLPSPKAKFIGKPHISGKDGGHTINLHQFARDGVVLLGRVRGVHGDELLLASDLKENLANADEFEADVVQRIDDFIAKTGLRAPIDTLPALGDGFLQEDRNALKLKHANVTSVIWATGYEFDFSLVHFPVLDGDGYPIQERGVTAFPGLYFVGLPWLHDAKSGLLFGLEQDASHIAQTITERTQHRPIPLSPIQAAEMAVRDELPKSAHGNFVLTPGSSITRGRKSRDLVHAV